jgi:hypothetical protein
MPHIRRASDVEHGVEQTASNPGLEMGDLFRRAKISALIVCSVILSAIGCDGEFQGSNPVGPSPTNPRDTSSLTWMITDACNDRRGIRLRFYDATNNLVWPRSSEVYVLPSGETRQETLTCRTNVNICFGARTDPEGTNYWGVDLDGNRRCDDCCTPCEDKSVSKRLTCD